MKEPTRQAGNLNMVGGRLCLDFANTVDGHGSDQPREYLQTYSDLIDWSEHAGILSRSQSKHLQRQAQDQPEEAAAVLEQALALREVIYRIFMAVAQGSHCRTEDLALLNDHLVRVFGNLQVVREGEVFRWDWRHRDSALDQMLWPIARSAAELLTSDDLARVKQCAETVERCGWLFVDTSKNHSRRWCDMKDCGNRAKVRQYLERQRAAA